MGRKKGKTPWDPWEIAATGTPGSQVQGYRQYRRCVNYPCQISVRATEQEKESIDLAAREAGLSQSRYLARTVVEERYPPTLADREELRRVRLLLEKAGVNLNQVARQLNAYARGSTDMLPALADIRTLAWTMKNICHALDRSLP